MLKKACEYQQSGLITEAEALFRKVLADDPANHRATHGLGFLAAQAGQIPLALDLLTRVVNAAPNDAEARSQLGFALHAAGKSGEAIASFREAIRLRPDFTTAYENLGVALWKRGEFDEAIAVFEKGLSIAPGMGQLHFKLGNAFQSAGRLEEAARSFREALRLMPHDASVRNQLGVVLQGLDLPAAAVEIYREGLRLAPDALYAQYGLGISLRGLGLVEEAVEHLHIAANLAPGRSDLLSTLLLTLPYHPGLSAGEILAAHREWNRRHAEPLAEHPSFATYDRSPDRPLRIGYVSPDMFDHPVGRNLLPLFREHDRTRVHFICYSNAGEDTVNTRLRELAGGWRDTHALNNQALAEMIRADRIDILVDLALHSEGNRLLAFARRLAPVQVTFAGYPGSTGLGAIDYRLTDPWLDPVGVGDKDYVEKSVRLPDTFWCYDREGMMLGLDSEPVPGPLPAIENGFVTFGSLNNFAKINGAVLTRWAEVLRACPGSRLMLLAPRDAHGRVFAELGGLGIASERIEMVTRVPRGDYLRLFGKIDISLDTLPYNGHTTSLDSLWMGVPVVTLAGKTVVSRAGCSQLQNLGLQELIAANDAAFGQIALNLANDLDRLKALRASLRHRMERSPLGDAAGFARGIENAYREMWWRWCGAGRY